MIPIGPAKPIELDPEAECSPAPGLDTSALRHFVFHDANYAIPPPPSLERKPPFCHPPGRPLPQICGVQPEEFDDLVPAFTESVRRTLGDTMLSIVCSSNGATVGDWWAPSSTLPPMMHPDDAAIMPPELKATPSFQQRAQYTGLGREIVAATGTTTASAAASVTPSQREEVFRVRHAARVLSKRGEAVPKAVVAETMTPTSALAGSVRETFEMATQLDTDIQAFTHPRKKAKAVACVDFLSPMVRRRDADALPERVAVVMYNSVARKLRLTAADMLSAPYGATDEPISEAGGAAAVAASPVPVEAEAPSEEVSGGKRKRRGVANGEAEAGGVDAALDGDEKSVGGGDEGNGVAEAVGATSIAKPAVEGGEGAGSQGSGGAGAGAASPSQKSQMEKEGGAGEGAEKDGQGGTNDFDDAVDDRVDGGDRAMRDADEPRSGEDDVEGVEGLGVGGEAPMGAVGGAGEGADGRTFGLPPKDPWEALASAHPRWLLLAPQLPLPNRSRKDAARGWAIAAPDSATSRIPARYSVSHVMRVQDAAMRGGMRAFALMRPRPDIDPPVGRSVGRLSTRSVSVPVAYPGAVLQPLRQVFSTSATDRLVPVPGYSFRTDFETHKISTADYSRRPLAVSSGLREGVAATAAMEMEVACGDAFRRDASPEALEADEEDRVPDGEADLLFTDSGSVQVLEQLAIEGYEKLFDPRQASDLSKR